MLIKNIKFGFGLKPAELRCKSGRFTTRKWAVYNSLMAHFCIAFLHYLLIYYKKTAWNFE